MSNLIVWADIPVTDLKRAADFYSHVTGYPVAVMPGSNDTVAVIGDATSGVSADLYIGKPTHDGPTVYLGSGGDIDAMVERVVAAGGKVLGAKAFMGDMIGWLAFVEDTEGNRIGIQQSA